MKMSKLPPHSRRVANTYAHMGLTRAKAPEAYRRLVEAKDGQEASQIAVDWLEQRRVTEQYAGARERTDEGADTGSPAPMPRHMQEELAQLKREAEESGDSRLADWLIASEPLLIKE